MENETFKACSFCKEQIRKEAVKCRFCGEWLEQPYSGIQINPNTALHGSKKDSQIETSDNLESAQRISATSVEETPSRISQHKGLKW